MARPLDFQMPVEDEVLRELRKILQQASEEISEELASESSERIGEAVSRAQAEAILRATKAHLQGDWRSINDALSQSRKLAAMAAVEGFYDQMSGPLSTLLGSDGSESFVRAQAAAAATRIDSVMARLTESRRSLSSQVWQTRALSNRWLDSKINQALARGWDAKRLAREVVQFVDPNVPGGASYAAMRLARTEINNAFHAQTLQSMADSGVVEYVKWNLSRSHPDRDICDDLAEHRLGEDIPGQPKTPEPEWKPSMSAQEAERWNAESKIKQPLYHGTSSTTAKSIERDGFSIGSSGSNTGTEGLYGRGIYLAPDRDVASLYSSSQNPVILETRALARNPMRVSQSEATPGFAEFRKSWMSDNPDVPFENAVPRAMQDYAKSLGHDSIVRIDKDEILEVVLFDKEQVVVVDGD